MSDGFWAGLFVALPAIFASILAYRKSEIATSKANETERILREEVKNGNGSRKGATIASEVVMPSVRRVVQELALQEMRIQLLERKMGQLDPDSSLEDDKDDPHMPPRGQDHE
jgi:hypothetical protein